MNTPQTEDDKRRIIADIILHKLPWQVRASQDREWAAPEPAGSIPMAELYLNTLDPFEIRIAPAPPKPEKWFPDKGQWYEEKLFSGKWYRGHAGYERDVYVKMGGEYRPCDPPPEPEWVELGPADVPPGSVFRRISEQTGWHNPVWVSAWGAYWSDGYAPWAHLKDSWQILRPGGTWEPCRKAKV